MSFSRLARFIWTRSKVNSKDVTDPFKCQQRFKESSFHKSGQVETWKQLTYTGLVLVGLLRLYLYLTVEEPERPEFVAYPHLRLRTTRFPWGDGNHTLFHNRKYNALPDGYEEEDEC